MFYSTYINIQLQQIIVLVSSIYGNYITNKINFQTLNNNRIGPLATFSLKSFSKKYIKDKNEIV